MYQASVPVFVKGLANLKAILEKATAHAQANKIDDAVFVTARLYPDMLPLSSQIQIASDFARGTTARLAGSEPPAMDDNEKTLADLIARVDKTIDYLKSFTTSQIDGSEAPGDHAKGPRPGQDVHRPQLPAAVCDCRTSTSTRRRRTTSCATTAWRSASWTSWAISTRDATSRGATCRLRQRLCIGALEICITPLYG